MYGIWPFNLALLKWPQDENNFARYKIPGINFSVANSSMYIPDKATFSVLHSLIWANIKGCQCICRENFIMLKFDILFTACKDF